MTTENQRSNLPCLACLETGKSDIVDTFFEDNAKDGSRVIVLTKCECGGVTRHSCKPWESKYISGSRKSVYPYHEDGDA